MRAFALASVLFVSLIGLSPVSAHGSLGARRATDLRDMAEAANLVVVADISGVEYRNTPIKGEQGTIPTTLVTVKIRQVLRGAAPNAPLVLRFLGGPDGKGGVAGFSGVPMFVSGETNILFIKANGDDACPLSNCEWGRFRVFKGAVYDTHGAPVTAVVKGQVVSHGRPPKELTVFRFPTPTFDAVMQHSFVKERFAKSGMSLQEARARYEREAPPFIAYSINFPATQETADVVDDPLPAGRGGAVLGPLLKKQKPPPKPPLGLDAFIKTLQPIAAGARRKPTPVASATLSSDFALPGIGKTAPKLPAVSQAPAAEMKEADDPLQGHSTQKKPQ
ncbi:MAG: hypothetical protein K2Q06_08735 [Parvularculaceae bacterium]|nr:hypothetical protein [Parvularculaceae bacterium]